ncbi:LPS export ABC transporter permease LptF [Ahrensia sp. R2A130]|uniref:LPS export ABC transporter permease LptF n=1 Tax=Ahrensia sp. R2A130 TaxID=744979 RepID=UPI0001E0942F|nr:LPS export ABC transporter permease LptF [Ahrensia sp. R2A130]EFL90592.1 permease YjgP/YjgQ family protein [Ahrensia sp. R2A130]
MGLSLLERYVFKKALVMVATALAGLVGVIWVVRAVQEVDVIMSKGQGIMTYLTITTLGVPSLIAAVAPLALMIGMVRTISALNDESEMVVMHASGASRWSLARPFLWLAGLMAIMIYFLSLYGGPHSLTKMRETVNTMRADLISVVVKDGEFQQLGGGLMFHIATRLPGGELKGVFITDTRDENEHLTYLADSGTISKIGEDAYLVLRQGQVQRTTVKTNNSSFIDFDSYAFNLSTFSGGTGDGKSRSRGELRTSELFSPDPADEMFKRAPHRFRVEFHTRFTSGLYAFMVAIVILVCMGNPQSHRQGLTVLITSTVVLVILLRGAGILVENNLKATPLLWVAVWGIPLLAIGNSFRLLATDKVFFPPDFSSHIQQRWEKFTAFIVSAKRAAIGPKLAGDAS